jgi:hypothetical protein
MAKYGPGRMLRHSFFTSADLMDLPDWAKLLWASIFSHADNEGWIRADPGYLRGLTWPHGRKKGPLAAPRPPCERSIAAACGVFLARMMLSQGTVERAQGAENVISYYRVTNFAKHQDMTWLNAPRNQPSKPIEPTNGAVTGPSHPKGRPGAGGKTRDHPGATPKQVDFAAIAAAALAAQGAGS